MLYRYTAADREGKMVEDTFDADNLEQVLQYLSGNDLTPISVKPMKSRASSWRDKLFGGKITLEDKLFIAKYLSLMLRVGTDLISAVNILIDDFEKPAVRNFLLEVRENLSKGNQFYEVFERHPKSFSPVFINLIKAAEKSGNLEEAFADLSVKLEKDAELQSRVRSALIYPAIILFASTLVFLFLVTFALPRIARVFSTGGINPPLFSRVVFSVGLFIGDHVWTILIGFFAIGGFIIYFFWKNTVGKRIGKRILSHLPVFRDIYLSLATQRFASTFSSLLEAGLPIVDATKITADVVGSEEYRVALNRIADEGLAKGLTVGEAFRREPVFPHVLVSLIAISEKAGHMEEVLSTLADFYAGNVDSSIKTLVSFLEPALLLLMGLLVGLIALSIIVPIYQLTTQF